MGWNTSVISVRGETDQSVWPVFNAPSPICHQLDFKRGSEESQQQSESQQEYRIVVLFPLIGRNLGTIRDLLQPHTKKVFLEIYVIILTKTRQNGIFFNLILLFWTSMLSLWLTQDRMATKGKCVFVSEWIESIPAKLDTALQPIIFSFFRIEKQLEGWSNRSPRFEKEPLVGKVNRGVAKAIQSPEFASRASFLPSIHCFLMVRMGMAMMIVFGVDDKGMRHPGKLTRGDFLRSFSNAGKFILSPRYCHQKTLFSDKIEIPMRESFSRNCPQKNFFFLQDDLSFVSKISVLSSRNIKCVEDTVFTVQWSSRS